MNKRWNANTWVLTILLSLIALMGFDIGRHALRGSKDDPKVPPPTPVSHDPKFKVGETAPDFILIDSKGKKHALSELVHQDTILAFNCGCSNCRDMETYLAVLFRKMGPQAPQAITVTSMPPEREESWYRDTQLKQTLLYVPHGDNAVMDMYQGHPCPRIFRLTPNRKVAWISPSLAVQPGLRDMAAELAANLGFSTPGHKLAGKPEAPEIVTDAPPTGGLVRPTSMSAQPVPPPAPGSR